MHPFLDASFGWLVALVTGCAFVGSGRVLCRVLGAESIGLAVEFAAGSWLASLLLTGIGLTVGLTPGGIFSVIAGMVSLGVLGLWQIWRNARRATEARTERRLPIWVHVALLAWLAPYLVQSMLPANIDWDTAMYHVPTALRFLEHGITFVDPHQAQLNFPAAIPMFYAVFLSIGAESALVPLNMLAVLILVFAVYEVGARHVSPRAGRIAAAMLLTTNLLMELGIDARNDGFLALYFFACAQGFFALRENPARVGLLTLMGMAMGMAYATKMTGLLAAGLFGVVALYLLIREKPKQGVPFLLLGILCVLIPSGFFFARNAVYLGDPIYPFLHGLQYKSPAGEMRDFYADFEVVYAAEEKPYDDFLVTKETPDEPRTILNLVDVFLNPERYQNRKYHWLQPLLFLAVLLPFFDRRSSWRRTSLWLFGLGVTSFLALGLTAHLTRYALPALPLLALGSAALIAPRHAHVQWLTLLVILGTGVHNHVREWQKCLDVEAFEYLTGDKPAYAWRIFRGYNGDPTAAVAAHKINVLIEEGKMSRSDTILMAGEAKFDLIRCNSIPDMSVELNLWLTEMIKGAGDYRRIRENLRALGVTHIMINKQHIMWVLGKLRLESKLQNRDYLRFGAFHLLRFLQEHSVEVFGTERTGDRASIELYRLT